VIKPRLILATLLLSQLTIVPSLTAEEYASPVKAEKILITTTAGDGQPHRGLKTRLLSANGHPVRAEVASTMDALEMGLKHRSGLGWDDGLLMVLSTEKRVCIWMKDTLIPLSVAFMNGDGVVIDMADMAPGTNEPRCAGNNIRYVLEMNLGWFAVRGISRGSRINGVR